MVMTQFAGNVSDGLDRRIRFSNITADSFGYEVFASEDGETWTAEVTLRYARR